MVVEDFNLDFAKRHDNNYARKNFFDDFENKLGNYNLVQIVNFPTWSRIVGTNI